MTYQNDMAIGMVMFNTTHSKRIIMNYLYTVNEFRRHGFPVYTLELCFGNSKPEISDSIVVRGNSHMFHKERLCRILETKIPSVYSKIVFVDADILFDSPDWYRRTSELLNTHDVVHPFHKCKWLDLTYQNVMKIRESAVLSKTYFYDCSSHPGFAWAFRRDWYQSVGFYDYAISGGGDAISSSAWLGKSLEGMDWILAAMHKPSYREFSMRPRPRITNLDGISVTHLYHGANENRQYGERNNMLQGVADIRTLLYENQDGVYEWRDPSEWNPKFLGYFTKRKDDAL